MKQPDTKVECRCPGCKTHYWRRIDLNEPPPRKGNVYLMFCDQCRKGTLYTSEEPPSPQDN